MRKCTRCGTFGNNDLRLTQIEDHHIIPTKGWDGNNETVTLCKRCHDILHHTLLAFVGKQLKIENEKLWNDFRNKIKKYSEWWIKKSGVW